MLVHKYHVSPQLLHAGLGHCLVLLLAVIETLYPNEAGLEDVSKDWGDHFGTKKGFFSKVKCESTQMAKINDKQEKK